MGIAERVARLEAQHQAEIIERGAAAFAQGWKLDRATALRVAVVTLEATHRYLDRDGDISGYVDAVAPTICAAIGRDVRSDIARITSEVVQEWRSEH